MGLAFLIKSTLSYLAPPSQLIPLSKHYHRVTLISLVAVTTFLVVVAVAVDVIMDVEFYLDPDLPFLLSTTDLSVKCVKKGVILRLPVPIVLISAINLLHLNHSRLIIRPLL